MAAQEVTETFLSAVHRLEPLIREYADEAERNRRLSQPVVTALAEAGFFRLYLPRTLGGFVDVATMPWHEPFPGLRMKVLYKDDDAKEATILFETQPGTVIPEHVHGGVEWAFVLEGTMEDAEGVCTAGNFVMRPAGSRHTVRTPNGAKYIGFFHGSARSVATGRLFPEYGEKQISGADLCVTEKRKSQGLLLSQSLDI